nr:digestive organ expansion factor homolog [Ipomoea batatas]
MVSDASSGPPQFVEEEDYGNDNNNGCSYHAAPPVNSAPALPVKRQKKKENRRRSIGEHPSALDDTASSPIFNLSNNNFTINNQASVENVVLDFSQGYSTTHLQGRSVYQEQYGFFMPSLLPENQLLGSLFIQFGRIPIFKSFYAIVYANCSLSHDNSLLYRKNSKWLPLLIILSSIACKETESKTVIHVNTQMEILSSKESGDLQSHSDSCHIVIKLKAVRRFMTQIYRTTDRFIQNSVLELIDERSNRRVSRIEEKDLLCRNNGLNMLQIDDDCPLTAEHSGRIRQKWVQNPKIPGRKPSPAHDSMFSDLHHLRLPSRVQEKPRPDPGSLLSQPTAHDYASRQGIVSAAEGIAIVDRRIGVELRRRIAFHHCP